jgi:hypothetical protein
VVEQKNAQIGAVTNGDAITTIFMVTDNGSTNPATATPMSTSTPMKVVRRWLGCSSVCIV